VATESLTQDRLLLTIEETARALGLSRAQLFRLRTTRDFPQPIRLLGPASHPRWRPVDLESYVEKKQKGKSSHE